MYNTKSIILISIANILTSLALMIAQYNNLKKINDLENRISILEGKRQQP